MLGARVKANLAQYRRLTGREKSTAEITLGNVRINTDTHRVYVKDREVELKNKEYELLLFLMRHPGQVFSREDLYELIWGLESMGDNITVAVHVGRIREKIEDDPANPKLLQTIWGVGYRLNAGTV